MSKKVTVTLGPVISAANSGRGVTWETSQQNGSGHPVSATGTRKVMLKIFKATITDRVSEGFTVEAKVLTAAGQLEEHATYRPDGTANWHHVPPPAGEGAFGRRCRDLGETPLARKQRREATAPPKPAPAPKAPRQRAAPKGPTKLAGGWTLYMHDDDLPKTSSARLPKAAAASVEGLVKKVGEVGGAQLSTKTWNDWPPGSIVVMQETGTGFYIHAPVAEKPAKEPKPRVASKPAVEKPAKEPKPKAARSAAAEKPAGGRRTGKGAPADDPMGAQFDNFIQFAMSQQPAS